MLAKRQQHKRTCMSVKEGEEMEWNMKQKTFINMDRIIRYVKRPEVYITRIYSYIPKLSTACFLHVRRKLIQFESWESIAETKICHKILDVYG